MAAFLEENSFYYCSVCLFDMTERNPRLLACHHCFCEDCLKKLVKGGNIECPTCRHLTPVAKDDITLLSKNFMLLEMKDREKKLLASPKTVTVCQLCGREAAGHKCLDCNELMCQTCNMKHSKAVRYKTHKVVVKCANHDEGISHICVKCVKEACSKCIIVDHSDHDDRVHVYENGMGLLHASIENYTSTVKKQIKSVETILKEDQKKIMIEKEQQQSLQEKRDWYLAEAAKIKDILDNMKTKHAKQQTVHGEYEEVLKVGKEVTKKSEKLNKIEGKEFLLAYHELKTNLESTYDKTNQVRSKYGGTYVPVKFSFSNILGGKAGLITLRPSPKQVSAFTTTHFKLNIPWQVACLDKDILAVADFDEMNVPVVDYGGNMLCSYGVSKDDKEVTSVYAHDGNTVYIVQRNCITSAQYPSTNTTKYRPSLPDMRGMCVLDDTKYIIYNKTTVCEYEPETKNVTQVVAGLNCCNMCLPYKDLDISNQMRYLVIDDNKREDNIKVYNDRWNLLHSFGAPGILDGRLDGARRAVIVDKNLLVCEIYNHRVSCFTLEGEFKFHVLTDKEGIKYPFGIDFSFPYLWISEVGIRGHKATVKCFDIGRSGNI